MSKYNINYEIHLSEQWFQFETEEQAEEFYFALKSIYPKVDCELYEVEDDA